MRRARRFLRQEQTGAFQRLGVSRRDAPARRVVSVKVGQFDPKHGRLHLVKARIPARPGTDVPFAPTVLAKEANIACDLWIIRHHRAAISERTEVLGRIKTEAARVAPGTHAPATYGGTVSLRAILDHFQAILLRDREDFGD